MKQKILAVATYGCAGVALACSCWGAFWVARHGNPPFFNLLLVLLGPFSILLGGIAVFSKSKPGYALATITVFSTWAFLACVAILPARFLAVQLPSVVYSPPPPFSIAPPPPYPLPSPCPDVKRIRVAPEVEVARLVFHPQPVYPASAKAGRIRGIVRLDAVINQDGTVQDMRVISGHALLVRAALEAVKRWRYQPTLLNGEPVEVATEIDVNFALPQ
jgi:TonB family protein